MPISRWGGSSRLKTRGVRGGAYIDSPLLKTLRSSRKAAGCISTKQGRKVFHFHRVRTGMTAYISTTEDIPFPRRPSLPLWLDSNWPRKGVFPNRGMVEPCKCILYFLRPNLSLCFIRFCNCRVVCLPQVRRC